MENYTNKIKITSGGKYKIFCICQQQWLRHQHHMQNREIHHQFALTRKRDSQNDQHVFWCLVWQGQARQLLFRYFKQVMIFIHDQLLLFFQIHQFIQRHNLTYYLCLWFIKRYGFLIKICLPCCIYSWCSA